MHDAWYLAQLKPGGLDRAVVNLARQGFDSLMPVREETRRRAGRWRTIAKPLFPGYLFVKVPAGRQDWRAINATYGVSRLVTLEAGRPTPVAPEIVCALQMRARQTTKSQQQAGMEVGDRVEVVSGPLATKFAEIEAISEQGRIYVLLELMGRYTRIELPVADVEHRSVDAEPSLA